MESECQGCNDYDDQDDKCMAPGISNKCRYNAFKDICPCVICLVKGICEMAMRRYPFKCINFYHARGRLWQKMMRQNDEEDNYPM